MQRSFLSWNKLLLAYSHVDETKYPPSQRPLIMYRPIHQWTTVQLPGCNIRNCICHAELVLSHAIILHNSIFGVHIANSHMDHFSGKIQYTLNQCNQPHSLSYFEHASNEKFGFSYSISNIWRPKKKNITNTSSIIVLVATVRPGVPCTPRSLKNEKLFF